MTVGHTATPPGAPNPTAIPKRPVRTPPGTHRAPSDRNGNHRDPTGTHKDPTGTHRTQRDPIGIPQDPNRNSLRPHRTEQNHIRIHRDPTGTPPGPHAPSLSAPTTAASAPQHSQRGPAASALLFPGPPRPPPDPRRPRPARYRRSGPFARDGGGERCRPGSRTAATGSDPNSDHCHGATPVPRRRHPRPAPLSPFSQ